jgi:hypothetical protein
MTATAGIRTPRITGLRAAVLVIVWLAFAYVVAPSFGLYYERLAAWYTLPSLGLVYAYCLSHRSRWAAILAVFVTIAGVLVIGFAAVFPKGSAA